MQLTPVASGAGALLVLGCLAAAPPSHASEAEDLARVVRSAYAGYDPATESIPASWRNPPASWLNANAPEATHVVIRIEATRAWGSSHLLALATLAYETRIPATGASMERRQLYEKKAELLLLRPGSLELHARADLGSMHPDVQGDSELRFDNARFDLTEGERAAAVRIVESEAVVGMRAVYSQSQRLELFRVGEDGLQKVFDRPMFHLSGTGECTEETEEEAFDRCGCQLDDAACMAETTTTEEWVLVVSKGRTGGLFDLQLRGTEESRAGGKLSAPVARKAETWRFDGRRYAKQEP
jgi:hypothetical protein